MVGVNVAVPAPMAFFPFSGWNESFFGDLHLQGREGVAFYTQQKVTTSRWFGDADVWEKAYLVAPIGSDFRDPESGVRRTTRPVISLASEMPPIAGQTSRTVSLIIPCWRDGKLVERLLRRDVGQT